MANLIGKQFGRWMVKAYAERDKRGNAMFLCVCSCGKTDLVRGASLLNGHSNSCGCIRIEALEKRSTIHGQASRGAQRTRTYLIWQSMVGRCCRPSDTSYKLYGAKGITVCDRWREFGNFLEDMGAAPPKMHIHRVSNATIYSKETCTWMDGKEHIAMHNKARRKSK
jgi:hypothetical protein